MAMCVLPVPDGPSSTTFSARSTKLERGELLDLRPRRAGGKGKVEGLERLDGREAGDPGQHVASPGPPCLALGLQHLLQEVGVGGVLLLRRALGNRRRRGRAWPTA